MKKLLLIGYKLISVLVFLAVAVNLVRTQWKSYCWDHGLPNPIHTPVYVSGLFLCVLLLPFAFLWIVAFVTMCVVNSETLRTNRIPLALSISALVIYIVTLLMNCPIDDNF